MINKKLRMAVFIVLLGLYIQPILAQGVEENLTATVNILAGEEGNQGLKGNFIITENEGKDQNINISFTDLIEENSDQVIDKSGINIISPDLNNDTSKYAVAIKAYGVWVGEISINTTGIKSGTYNGKAIIEGANITPLDIGLTVKLAKPALNLTATINTLVGEEGNKVLKGNFIITENEGKDQNINISFTDLIEENSDQVIYKSGIHVIYPDQNRDKSKYAVSVKGYSAWVGEISINTMGIKSGTYNGTVIIEGTNIPPLDIGLSVKLAKPIWKKLVVLGLTAFFILIAVVLILKVKDPINGTIGAFIVVVLGTLALSLLPFFDAQENAILTASFFIPLAAYLIDFLKGRRDERLVLEKSVTETKKTAIGEAINFHSTLLEELNNHAATFSCTDCFGANPLESAALKEVKNKAGMVSHFSGYRLARYYQYTDEYNKYLEVINTGATSLKDPKQFKGFCTKFEQLNKAYKELEEILYINLCYNIGSFEYTFRFFKEIKVPFHLPKKLRLDLAKILEKDNFHILEELRLYLANLGDKEKINNDKIYNEKVDIALMEKIEEEFKINYTKLQTALKELKEFELK